MPLCAGIAFALLSGVRTEDERLEHRCRMGLLVVMLLHWLVFALLVTNSVPVDASGGSDFSSNLAALLAPLLSC